MWKCNAVAYFLNRKYIIIIDKNTILAIKEKYTIKQLSCAPFLRPALKIHDCMPSITDGVHRNENVVEIIPVFSTF